MRTKSEGDSFNFTVTDLDPASSYNFVAYVTIEGETYYSELKSTSTNTGQVFTDSIFYQGKFELKAYGHLTGTKQGLIAVEHGFCWRPYYCCCKFYHWR